MPADVGFFRAVGGIVFGNRQLFLIIGQIRFLTLIIFFNIGFLFRRQLVGKFADVNVFPGWPFISAVLTQAAASLLANSGVMPSSKIIPG